MKSAMNELLSISQNMDREKWLHLKKWTIHFEGPVVTINMVTLQQLSHFQSTVTDYFHRPGRVNINCLLSPSPFI